MYKIYKYTNKINGKKYIGQTMNSLEERAQSQGSNYQTCPRFWNAIQKYGWASFIGEIIIDNIKTKEEANYLEQYYISVYQSDNEEYGYNISSGVHSSKSEYERNLISEKAKERYKDSSKNPMYGKKHNLESIQKMSDCKKGFKNPMFGKHMSEESKEKRRKTCIEKEISFSHTVSDENKKKASIRMKERAKKWSKPVRCLEDGKVFSSISECAKYYGVCDTTMSEYLYSLNKEKRTCAKGRHFEFVINN